MPTTHKFSCKVANGCPHAHPMLSARFGFLWYATFISEFALVVIATLVFTGREQGLQRVSVRRHHRNKLPRFVRRHPVPRQTREYLVNVLKC